MATPVSLDYSSLSFPVEVRLIPAGQVNQRSGLALAPAYSTWHDTDNKAKGGVMSSLTPRMPGSNTRRSAATGASTSAAKQVWVLPKDGKGPPVSVAVTPGISDGRLTEITGGELTEGMAVITDQRAAGAAP